MEIHTVEAHWVESRSDYGIDELSALTGLPVDALHALIAHGALEDAGVHRAESVVLVRSARRLRDDFELDDNGLAVALSLLRRVRSLEREIAALRAIR